MSKPETVLAAIVTLILLAWLWFGCGRAERGTLYYDEAPAYEDAAQARQLEHRERAEAVGWYDIYLAHADYGNGCTAYGSAANRNAGNCTLALTVEPYDDLDQEHESVTILFRGAGEAVPADLAPMPFECDRVPGYWFEIEEAVSTCGG